jgi:hypothetical protein
MATWSVKPQWKKSIIERNYLVKGGNTIMIETGWRWGEFTVETDDDGPPNIEAGVDIYDCGYESELVETNDGCWEEHSFEDCDEETQEWLEEFFDEGNSWLDLEEHGWSQDECEMIIDCDLIIERLDDDGNPTGEIIETGGEEDDTPKEPMKLEPGAAWPFSRPPEPPVENAQFKCEACDFATDDIDELVENPNDDDKGAFVCPVCGSKVDLG